MLAPLLSTKLHIPTTPAGFLQRARLIERLNQGLVRKLTLVSAPAGYGKTTLVSDWVRRIEVPAAWISLDASDGDMARFLAYLVAALQTVDPDIGTSIPDMLQPPRPEPVKVVLTTLINELSSFSKTFVLVLDDYHEIEAPPVHEAICFLIDHLPSNMHLVIATRADPPLPLAHLRGRGQLVELRAADLQFSPQESTEFLNRVMGLSLSSEEVGALATRTEGWVAALQIAATSMQGRKDTSRFIHSFTGSTRHILDYLLEVVLEELPENVRIFLLRTSILDRLTGPLCDFVTDQSDSQSMLERLEKSNLFVVPLDDQRRWYRYHRLFSDLLRQQLQQTQPDILPRLHRRASQWLEQNGLPAEAIDHALAARDFERAANLIENAAEPTLMRSEVMTFLNWVEALPGEFVRARPSLCIYHAWVLLLSGQPLERVLARLQDAEAGQLSAEANVFRALSAVLVGDALRSLELSQQALECIPEESHYWRSLLMNNLGMAYVIIGDIESAVQAFDEGVRISQKSGNMMFTVAALSNLAGLCREKGQFQRAQAIARQALELATDAQGRRMPVAGRALLILGELAREHNDLEAAACYLNESLELFRQYGEIGTLMSYLHLARVRQAQNDTAAANEMLQKAQEIAVKSEATQMDDRLVTLSQVRLWIQQGNLEAASRWARDRELEIHQMEDETGIAHSQASSFFELHEIESLTLARVHLAQGNPGKALEALVPLWKVAEKQDLKVRRIEILNLQALALRALGQTDEALAVLEQALRMAEPEGLVRTFIDEGLPMAELLYEAASRRLAPEYIGKLLAAYPEGDITRASKKPAGPKQAALVEALSQRELEVLQLIAEGLTNREIADRLVISLSTVKGHTSNIYSKLGVSSRTHATAMARELGILP